MIWQENIRFIVMLTNVVENGKVFTFMFIYTANKATDHLFYFHLFENKIPALKNSYKPQLLIIIIIILFCYFTKKNKCAQYWPEKVEPLEVGPCKMHLLKESTYALYTCRKFTVHNSMVRQLKMKL